MRRLTWTLVAFALAGQARADVIYTNLGPGESYRSDFGWGEQGLVDGVSERQALSFSVGTNARFDGARLALGLVSGANEMDLRIYTSPFNVCRRPL
jgi:hypothetical protein